MKQVTYWLNRKAFRDSVDYGTTCPPVDNLSLGDSIWTRTVGKDGLPVWDVHMTTRATTEGLAIDTWNNRGDKPELLNTVVLEV